MHTSRSRKSPRKPSNFGKFKPESIELSGIRGIATRHGYNIKDMTMSLYNLKDDVGSVDKLISTVVAAAFTAGGAK